MLPIIIDIDDTLIKSEYEYCEHCGRKNYKNAKPIKDEIDRLNKLYDRGLTIILHTGRGWDCYKITIEQLKRFGVKYHQLVMGKPSGVIIDADARTSLKELE